VEFETWEDLVAFLRTSGRDLDGKQLSIARCLHRNFGGGERRAYGDRTIDDAADQASLSRSYVYELLSVFGTVGEWWESHPDVPIGILRATMRYDRERCIDMLNEWLSQGQPPLIVWLQYLEQGCSAESGADLLDVAISILRRSRRAGLNADVAKAIPLRGMKAAQVDAIDNTCEFYVRLRARVRAIKRARARGKSDVGSTDSASY
jgi:hypothetical protein